MLCFLVHPGTLSFNCQFQFGTLSSFLLFQALLGYGAKKNAHNFQGVSILYIAAQKGFYGVVMLLLDAGANVNAANLETEATSLMVATGVVCTILSCKRLWSF